MANEDFQKLINEYTLDYCHFLEAVYGESMMSEGGEVAIDLMFEQVDLANKIALDIGAGLGGTAFYLAKKFSMMITGLDINPNMVAEASKRIPVSLQRKVCFKIYNDLAALPFAENNFDLVYSKGVLTHVKDKTPLFKEIARVIKPNGFLVINDWLSPIDNHWDKRILTMCEMENLTLYAVSLAHYQQLLLEAGFEAITTRNDSATYAKFNQQQVAWLQDEQNASAFKARFGKQLWLDACKAYQLIADTMQDGGLLVQNFVCRKKT